jgi:nitrogen fixation/metabolism regulation signal transduction histidine kinase
MLFRINHKKWFRFSLRLKLIIVFTVVYATFMSIFIYLDLAGVHRLIEAEMKRTSVSFAKTLAFASSGAIVSQNVTELQKYAGKAVDEPYVMDVVIQDSENRVLASTNENLIGTILIDDITDDVRSSGQIIIKEVGAPPKDLLHQSGHAFSVAVPIIENGKQAGIIRLKTYSRELNIKIMELGNRWVLFTLISIFIGGIVAVIIAWSVTKELTKLVAGSKKIAGGDLSHQVKIKTSDELKDLGDAFNQMAVKLKESHSNLENQVQERTAELLNSKRKLEGLFNGISDLMSVQDLNYNIRMTNKAAYQMLNLTSKKVVGEKCYKTYFQRSKVCDGCPVKTTMESKKPAFLEVKHRGEIFHLYTYPILDSSGKLESVIEFGKIVTKEKVLEKQLIQSSKLASLGELVSCVAHEIRNPLAGIKTGAQFIGKRLNKKDETREVLNMIKGEINRLEEVVNSFLNFARPSRSVHKEMKITDVIDRAISITDDQIKKQNIDLLRDYNKEVPAISIDEKQMQQVFLNIIINAIQVMPDGGKLDIKTSYTDDYIYVKIRDTGPGLPKNKINVFDPFFTTKTQGTGLGLSITKRILEEHDASITGENENEGGAVFTVQLPVVKLS